MIPSWLNALVALLPLVLRRPICNRGWDSACESSRLTLAISSGNVTAVHESLMEDAVQVLNPSPHSAVAPLHLACYLGDVPIAVALLQFEHQRSSAATWSPVLDAPAANGQTCLSLAVETGHLELATALLRAGASINARSDDGSTALVYAMRRSNYEAVTLLLQHKADTNIKSRGLAGGRRVPASITQDPAMTGFSTLAFPTSPLQIAVTNGAASVVGQLLAAGARVEEANDQGVTPVMMAAMLDATPILDQLLNACSSSGSQSCVEATAAGGFTALLFAVWNRRVAAVASLVRAGADLHAENEMRQGALHLATRTRHTGVLSAVLDHLTAAGLEAEGEDDLSDARSSAVGVGSAVSVDAQGEVTQAPRRHMAAAVQSINKRDIHGMTPYLLACRDRWQTGMQLLQAAGADTCASNRNGLTCIMLATGVNAASGLIPARDAAAIIAAAIQPSGDSGVSCDLQAKSQAGMTALALSIVNGQSHMAVALLEAGSDPLAPLPDGRSIARAASESGLSEVTTWLREHPTARKAQ